jgi:hypothetical protein
MERNRGPNDKTNTQNNIGDGIPKVPGRIWLQDVGALGRKLFRGSNPHKRPSNAAPPPEADISGPPITTEQRPRSSLPITTQPLLTVPGTDGDIGAVRSDPEATGPQAAMVLPGASPIIADDNAAPQSENGPTETRKTAMIPVPPSALSSSSRDGTTEDAIAPAVRADPDEQDGTNIGHEPKQKQDVLVQSASHECGQSQREQNAMRNVSTVLEHYMEEYERMRIAIGIDMEDYEGSRRVCVTCYDGAVDKARNIERILSKTAKGSHGFSYVVRRKRDDIIFGFKGPIVNPNSDVTSENSSNDAYDVDQPHISKLPSRYRGNRPNGRDQPFSSTPYWTIGSTMVEAFCGYESNSNIAGTPIRMETKCRNGSSTMSMWTCGGIIKVGGVDYGLTTAHPLVLGSPPRPRHPPSQRPSMEDDDTTEVLFPGNNPLGGSNYFFSAEEHPEKYWQAVGKVSHYALAKTGSLPRNYDWLLFELPKDRSMWNNFGQNTKLVPDDLAVFSARGTLSAQILEGTAFLILGGSPFEVLKIELREPLRMNTDATL